MVLLARPSCSCPSARASRPSCRHGASLRIPLLVGFAAISVFALLLFGAETTCPGVDRTAGCAALIFPDWPLFDGQLVPAFSE